MKIVALMLMSCATLGLSDSATPGVAWKAPAWAAAGDTMHGNVQILEVSGTSFECRYTRPDGTNGSVALAPVEGEPGNYRFEVKTGAAPGTLVLTVAPEAGTAPVGQSCEVVVGDSVELEISGVAAERLDFPLEGWPADVVYVPCCNIYGGILQMLRFPDNPASAADGLRGTIISDFVMARPDETVRATAGLSLRFKLTNAEGATPQTTATTVYRWDGTRWGEVIGLKRDTTGISFSCADGGLFVLIRLP